MSCIKLPAAQESKQSFDKGDLADVEEGLESSWLEPWLEASGEVKVKTGVSTNRIVLT